MSILSTAFSYPVSLFKQIFATGRENKLSFAEIGWTVTIPKNFWLLSDKKLDDINKKADATLAAVIGGSFETKVYKHLFTARQLQGFFAASITNVEETGQAEWQKQNEEMYNAVYTTFKSIYADYQRVSIDTEREKRQKDHIIFDTLKITVSTPARLLSATQWYWCVINNYGLMITTCSEDEQTGESILGAIRGSVFSK